VVIREGETDVLGGPQMLVQLPQLPFHREHVADEALFPIGETMIPGIPLPPGEGVHPQPAVKLPFPVHEFLQHDISPPFFYLIIDSGGREEESPLTFRLEKHIIFSVKMATTGTLPDSYRTERALHWLKERLLPRTGPSTIPEPPTEL
jgi:hypothetical protein